MNKILRIGMLFCSLILASVGWAKAADDTWDKHASVSVAENNNVFDISSAADLAWVANQVNGEPSNDFSGKTIKLAEDLNLYGYNWVPIGNSITKPFKGTFDGKGHTITNMKVDVRLTTNSSTAYGGLFGVIGDAIIQNVTIEPGNIGTVYVQAVDYAYAGAIAAYANEASYQIRNCHSKIRVQAHITSANTAGQYAYGGGIIGMSVGNDDKRAVIEQCSSIESVSAMSKFGESEGVFSGSIAAFIQNTTISECLSGGTVYCFTGGLMRYAGGLVGLSSSGCMIKNCYSISAVTAEYDYATYTGECGVYVGGICGGVSGETLIEHCYATGELSASLPQETDSKRDVWVGGIVGNVSQQATDACIRNSIALNTSIKIRNSSTSSASSKHLRRVLGRCDESSATLENVYAYGIMGLEIDYKSISIVDQVGATCENGSFCTLTALQTIFGDNNVWTISESNCPTLKNNPGETTTLANYRFTDINNTADLCDAVANAEDNLFINLYFNEYELSSPLIIKKPIKIENGSYGYSPIFKPAETWDDNEQSLIRIEGDAEGSVYLTNMIIANSQHNGLKVESAMKTVLERVTLQENAQAGMIVHSEVEAKELKTSNNSTSGSEWGGVYVANGSHSYTPSLTCNDRCSFIESTKQIWDATANKDAVHVPTTSTDWQKLDFGDIAIWRKSKMDIDYISENTYHVYAKGNNVTVEAEGDDKTTIRYNDTDYLTFNNTDVVHLYGGAKDATVNNVTITMNGGKLAGLYGGGYASSAEAPTANVSYAKIQISGGEIGIFTVGGTRKSKVNWATVDVIGTDEAQIPVENFLVGGSASPRMGAPAETWSDATCGVSVSNITFKYVKIDYMSAGGGQGNVLTGQSHITMEDSEIGSLYGALSDSYASEMNLTLTRTKLAGEFATMRRSKVGQARFTFNNCTFPKDEHFINYIGAAAGWANSDTDGASSPEINNVVYSFTDCTNTPMVYLGEGLNKAWVTVTGAPVGITKFDRGINADPNQMVEGFNQYLVDYSIDGYKTWTFDQGLTMEDGTSLSMGSHSELHIPSYSSLAELRLANYFSAQVYHNDLEINKLLVPVYWYDTTWSAFGFPSAFAVETDNDAHTRYTEPSDKDGDGVWIAGLSDGKLPFKHYDRFQAGAGLMAATWGPYVVESTEKVTLHAAVEPEIPEAGKFVLYANQTLSDMTLGKDLPFYVLNNNNEFLPYEGDEPYVLEPFHSVLLTDAKTFSTLRSIGIGEGGATAKEWIAKEGYYLTTERGAIVVHTAEPIELYVVSLSGVVVYSGTVTDGHRILLPAGLYAVNGQIVRVK